jgi:hypothetical protein
MSQGKRCPKCGGEMTKGSTETLGGILHAPVLNQNQARSMSEFNLSIAEIAVTWNSIGS